MNYHQLAQNYKPKKIDILLIGEAPPPNGTSYFYQIPPKYSLKNVSIEKDASLPATIFNHYFGRRPNDSVEYKKFLVCLEKRGIFLIDIINDPIRIREKNGLNQANLNKLLSPLNLADLQKRIDTLSHENTEVIFLLARNKYKKVLQISFRNVKQFIPWKNFRLDTSQVKTC